jgi:hypothetical protein
MPENEPAVRREHEQRVVERPAVQLVDADGKNEPVLLGNRADPLGLRARHGD